MAVLGSLLGWLRFALWTSILQLIASAEPVPQSYNSTHPGLRLYMTSHHRIVMDNGLLQVTLSIPGGDITGIRYRGIDNVLNTKNADDNRGYWDVVWNRPRKRSSIDRLKGTSFKVVVQDEEQIELSFSRSWNLSSPEFIAPVNVDKRYIMRRGSSGFYFYGIFERLEGWPDIDMDQVRAVLKPRNDMFHFMAITDDLQKVMPTPADIRKGKRLAYDEAVHLTNTTNPLIESEVSDKYQYSCENKDNKVHGWISEDPPVGIWMISPSDEFRGGGPLKQDLTSHAGAVILSMFTSTHYTGKEMDTKYRDGKPWKKVFGPEYVYLNSVSEKENYLSLWEDAKEQMLIEVNRWPYFFPKSEDFPSSSQRGTLAGQLLIRDIHSIATISPASFAYVGLAPRGDVGSWQKETKGYQFWTRAGIDGYFVLENIRTGEYNLYAWVPGVLGDYRYEENITIEAGSEIRLGALVYDPPRNGPTLWEIGIPDRKAAEFYLPDPYPTLVTKLFIDRPTDKFRQYGLWDRYTDLYSQNDLVYTIGSSNYETDWFYAQVPRKIGNKTYEATTWQIVFELRNVSLSGTYTLQLALASATLSRLQVRFNDQSAIPPHFTTGLVGRDNAIARHGIHGLYRSYTIPVPSSRLQGGNNTIYLTQSRSSSPFFGIMYDYIRLEGPPQTTQLSK